MPECRSDSSPEQHSASSEYPQYGRSIGGCLLLSSSIWRLVGFPTFTLQWGSIGHFSRWMLVTLSSGLTWINKPVSWKCQNGGSSYLREALGYSCCFRQMLPAAIKGHPHRE